jgi:hypothetical protein
MSKSFECHFCKKTKDEDHFCHGCKHTVCEDCDTNFDMPFGPHSVDTHVEESWPG